MSNRPYWFPVLCDEEYFYRLRTDYPEKAHMSDEELHGYFNNGLKYVNLWDHTDDAYSDYEPLADSYLEILGALIELRDSCIGMVPDCADKVDAAIARAEGRK